MGARSRAEFLFDTRSTSTCDVFDRLVSQNRAESVDLTRPTSIPSKNGAFICTARRMYSPHDYGPPEGDDGPGAGDARVPATT